MTTCARHRASLLATSALALATLFVFRQVGSFEFISLDDTVYVAGNPWVRAGLTPEGIRWAFTSTQTAANWHPLTWLSHMLDVECFGMDPGKHHLVSLALHTINGALLFLVLKGMSGAPLRSAAVAFIFAVHPLHVESVAWISERKDVLSAFFFFLTLGAYLLYVRRPGGSRYFLVFFAFALGLTAKPMLVTLPFVLLLLDFWPLGRLAVPGAGAARDGRRPPPPVSLPWLFLEKTPLLVLSALSSAVTVLAQQRGGAINVFQQHDPYLRLSNALTAYLGYLAKVFVPLQLSVYYPLAEQPASWWQVAGAAAVVAGISILVVLAARRQGYLAAGWFWYAGTLVPVIGLVQVGGQSMADRYTYLPLIGIAIAVVWWTHALAAARRAAPALVALVAGLAAAPLALTAHAQAGHWRNSQTLFERALAVNPDNWLAHNALGLHLAERGRLEEAIGHYEAALRTTINEKVIVNYGNALLRLSKPDAAIAQYAMALAVNPDLVVARYNQANVLAARGRLEDAIGQYRQVLHRDPAHDGAHNNLGLTLIRTGRVEDGIRHYREAIRVNPLNAEAHNNLGFAMQRQGLLANAGVEYREALRLKPDFTTAMVNLGDVSRMRGLAGEALAWYRRALRVDPEHAAASRKLEEALTSER